MRRRCVPFLLLVLCVGCNDAEQRRQADRNQQAVTVRDNLKNTGQAMHNQNQENTETAATDSTSDNSAASAKPDADMTTKRDTPVND